jgi:activator of 2-hydroxyglutaryl-CoA dehydratase
MAKSINPKEVIFFDGGGAKNIGIKKALEEELGLKIYVPPEPQFVIALGAALIGFDLISATAKS